MTSMIQAHQHRQVGHGNVDAGRDRLSVASVELCGDEYHTQWSLQHGSRAGQGEKRPADT